MSQDGALGYAEHGWSYSAILAHYYTGTALGQAPAGTKVRVLVGSRVKTLALESYVRGVVAAEMPASWPLAALEAQAVASRTYALTAARGRRAGSTSTPTRARRSTSARPPKPRAPTRAIAATAGQIVTYAGKPAITYFFASSGGHTEDVQDAFPGAAAAALAGGRRRPLRPGPGAQLEAEPQLRQPPARAWAAS